MENKNKIKEYYTSCSRDYCLEHNTELEKYNTTVSLEMDDGFIVDLELTNGWVDPYLRKKDCDIRIMMNGYNYSSLIQLDEENGWNREQIIEDARENMVGAFCEDYMEECNGFKSCYDESVERIKKYGH